MSQVLAVLSSRTLAAEQLPTPSLLSFLTYHFLHRRQLLRSQRR